MQAIDDRAPEPRIWSMCFGLLGVQFVWALQNGSTSRIFQTLGANVDDLPMLWIAAPVTGLLVQPIVGHLSDRTRGPLGRRRPWIIVGALFTAAALTAMPNATTIAAATLALWVLTASVNVAAEPFRALVADTLPPERRTTGYAVQVVFIGAGAVMASAMPWLLTRWLGISGRAAPGSLPPSVHLSFYIGAAVLLVTVGWTAARTAERPHATVAPGGLSAIIGDAANMPAMLKRLAAVQFFTWFALFALWVYAVPVVAARHYGTTDPRSAAFAESADWVGVLFAEYNAVAVLGALLLPAAAARVERRTVHAICLLAGGAGLAGFTVIDDPGMLWLPTLGIGCAWASILSLPYAMLADAAPPAKMGVYMGVHNVFLVLPQLVGAAVLGRITAVPGGDAAHVMMLAAVSMAVAALLSLVLLRE